MSCAEPVMESGLAAPGEFRLQAAARLAARRWRRLALGMAAGLALGLAAGLLLPKTYESQASVLPPKEPPMMLPGLAGLQAGAAPLRDLGLKNPADLYVGILKSRTIADRLIERFRLRERYRKKTLVQTRKELEKRTTITAGNDTIIHIAVEDREPSMAAHLANGYVEELLAACRQLALTEASQRRLFLEQELERERAGLARAEEELARLQQSTGVVRADGQIEASLQALARLRGEMAARQVALRSLGAGATERHPEYVRLTEEIRGLAEEMRRLQSATPAASGDPLIGLQRMPAAGLEYFRALREVKYREALFQFLVQQHEAARLDEARQGGVVQIVDAAVEPDRHAWPVWWLFMMAGGLAGLLAAFADLLRREALQWLLAEE